MKCVWVLVFFVAAVATALPVTIRFRHPDLNHLDWDLRRHLETAFINAKLADDTCELFPQKVLACRLPDARTLSCALKAHDVASNYWTSNLAPFNKDETWDISDGRQGHTWYKVLSELSRECADFY